MSSLENRKPFWISLMIIGILFGLSLPFLIDYVFQAGHSVGSQNIGDDYFRAVIWSVVLGFILLLLPFPTQIRKYVLGLWIARCFVTLGFMLIYENHYDLDAYHYFRESLTHLEPESFGLGRGTGFINWMAWTVNHWLPFTDSYHSLKVFWSFAGFMGSYVYYQIYMLFSEKHNPTLLVTLAAFPSAIFWSSILGKDPLTFLATALASYGGLALAKRFRWRYLFFALVGLAMVLAVRFWLAGLIVFALMASYFFQQEFSPKKKFIFSIVATSAMIFLVFITLNQWGVSGPEEFLTVLNKFSRSWGRGGSAQAPPTFASMADLALFVPQGVFASLFRPLPGEVLNVFGFLAGAENIILIIGAFSTWQGLKKLKRKDSLIIFILTFVVSWSLIYGFISYQNLGTASRFKLQVLPFMLILPFYIRTCLQREQKQ